MPGVEYGATVRLLRASLTIIAREYIFAINEDETAAVIPFECPPLNATGKYDFEVHLYDRHASLGEEDRLLAVLTRALHPKDRSKSCDSHEVALKVKLKLDIASVDAKCLLPTACTEAERPDRITNAEYVLAQPAMCDQGSKSRRGACSSATAAPITVLMAGLCLIL